MPPTIRDQARQNLAALKGSKTGPFIPAKTKAIPPQGNVLGNDQRQIKARQQVENDPEFGIKRGRGI